MPTPRPENSVTFSLVENPGAKIKEYIYLGIVGGEKDGLYRIEQRNKFSVGDEIEIMKPDGRDVPVKVGRILNEDGEEQDSAPHPKQVLYVDLQGQAEIYDILRVRAPVQ